MSREYDAIHEAVRLDPETVWYRLRRFLCSRGYTRNAQYERRDLVEDLMFWHPDEFIDRLEALVAECPRVSRAVVGANVTGRSGTPGVTRFYALQERLSDSRALS